MKRIEFAQMKRGGYDPDQVDNHIRNLETEVRRLRHELESVKQKEFQPTLYDPEGAVKKVLAAAQQAADKMVNEAETIAKERIDAYHESRRTELEAQKMAYDNERDSLAAKLSDVRAMQGELQAEVSEMVEQAKFKMKVISQVSKELEGLVANTQIMADARIQNGNSQNGNLQNSVPVPNLENSNSENRYQNMVENITSNVSAVPNSNVEGGTQSGSRNIPAGHELDKGRIDKGEMDKQEINTREAVPANTVFGEKRLPSSIGKNAGRQTAKFSSNNSDDVNIALENETQDLETKDTAWPGEASTPVDSQPTEFFDPLLVSKNN